MGLVTGACFAHLGHDVKCIDTDTEKIKRLNEGECPIYEEGLNELLKSEHLGFSTDLEQAVKDSEIIFICVGTPEKEDGSADLRYVFDVCKSVAGYLKDGQTIVIKSTLPVTAVPKIKELLDESGAKYNLVSNPEFLAQGTAVKDFLEPDRVVIGSNTEDGLNQVAKLYENVDAPIVKTNIESAIIAKYAANAFLATKVSFINSIASLCEEVGANVNDVAIGMGHDKRIGNRFLKAGIGYGGSCFPKDTKALVKMGDEVGVSFDILKAVDSINTRQREIVLEKLKNYLNDFDGKTICMLGLAFKPGTDDMRDAPSLYLAKELLDSNSSLQVFDPIVKSVKGFDESKLVIKDEAYQAAKGADAIVLVTEHPEFADLDFGKIKGLVRGNVIIDGRNFLDAKKLKDYGFDYEGIGI